MEDFRNDRVDVSNFLWLLVFIEIDCNFIKRGVDFFGGGFWCGYEKMIWFVVLLMGRGKVMSFIMDYYDIIFVLMVGVVVWLILRDFDVYVFLFVVKNIDGVDVNGFIFCYFFFLIYSGLLVYINGVFVVVVDRWNLERKVEDDKLYYGVNWNKVFMKDLVCIVYLVFFDDFKLFVIYGDFY